MAITSIIVVEILNVLRMSATLFGMVLRVPNSSQYTLVHNRPIQIPSSWLQLYPADLRMYNDSLNFFANFLLSSTIRDMLFH